MLRCFCRHMTGLVGKFKKYIRSLLHAAWESSCEVNKSIVPKLWRTGTRIVGIFGRDKTLLDKALLDRQRRLHALPQAGLRGQDPTNVFFAIVDGNKSLMQDVMLSGDYDGLVDQKEMHYPARLDEMFQKFSGDVHRTMKRSLLESKTEKILLQMTEMQGLTLPNLLSSTLMKTLVSEEIDKVSKLCIDLVPQTHDYARKFVFCIIDNSTSSFPNLNVAYKQEAENILWTSQETCAKFVRRVLDKERSNVFTTNNYYLANVEKIKAYQRGLKAGQTYYDQNPVQVTVEGFEDLVFTHQTADQSSENQSVLDMEVNLAAYSKVVYDRMVDAISLELLYSLENGLLRSLWTVMLTGNMGKDLSALMTEDASTQKRVRLRRRVDVLRGYFARWTSGLE